MEEWDKEDMNGKDMDEEAKIDGSDKRGSKKTKYFDIAN